MQLESGAGRQYSKGVLERDWKLFYFSYLNKENTVENVRIS